MKKLVFFFFLALLSLQCSSCSDDDPIEEASLSVNVDELSFPANSGSKFLSIQSNRDWVISERAVWLNVDMLFGSAADGEISVAVTVQKNPDADERTAIVTISADGLTHEVIVSQAGSELMIIEEDLLRSMQREAIFR